MNNYLIYNLPFSDFSLLFVTSISYLSSEKVLQARSMKGYLPRHQITLNHRLPHQMYLHSPPKLPLCQYCPYAQCNVNFSFLRFFSHCSELTTTSSFNPKVHPTISDLLELDNETILKQSKTDQAKKCHVTSKTCKKTIWIITYIVLSFFKQHKNAFCLQIGQHHLLE